MRSKLQKNGKMIVICAHLLKATDKVAASTRICGSDGKPVLDESFDGILERKSSTFGRGWMRYRVVIMNSEILFYLEGRVELADFCSAFNITGYAFEMPSQVEVYCKNGYGCTTYTLRGSSMEHIVSFTNAMNLMLIVALKSKPGGRVAECSIKKRCDASPRHDTLVAESDADTTDDHTYLRLTDEPPSSSPSSAKLTDSSPKLWDSASRLGMSTRAPTLTPPSTSYKGSKAVRIHDSMTELIDHFDEIGNATPQSAAWTYSSGTTTPIATSTTLAGSRRIGRSATATGGETVHGGTSRCVKQITNQLALPTQTGRWMSAARSVSPVSTVRREKRAMTASPVSRTVSCASERNGCHAGTNGSHCDQPSTTTCSSYLDMDNDCLENCMSPTDTLMRSHAANGREKSGSYDDPVKTNGGGSGDDRRKCCTTTQYRHRTLSSTRSRPKKTATATARPAISPSAAVCSSGTLRCDSSYALCTILTLASPVLTTAHIHELSAALRRIKNRVLIIRGDDSHDQKVFSQGTDLTIVKSHNSQDPILARYFFDLYMLAQLAATTRYRSVPMVAFWDGVVSGTAIGIFLHASVRVVSKGTVMSLPQTSSGYFPDGGMTQTLCGAFQKSKALVAPMAVYLALTGRAISGEDALYCGLGTHFCAESDMDELLNYMASFSGTVSVDALMAHVDASPLAKKHEDMEASSYRSYLQNHESDINWAFAASTVKDIFSRLAMMDSPWAQETTEALKARSPLALQLTLKALQRNVGFTFREVITTEYRMITNCLKQNIIMTESAPETNMILTYFFPLPSNHPLGELPPTI
eukprot:GEMP01006202.1.p1 GENE.GEMP01006202.1~~GEMP01006202.1.p1  ORF type:complete len:813 (-),score=125.36 GEMP01006202.1:1329-3767(-)